MRTILKIISLCFAISINAQIKDMKKIEFERITLYSLSVKEMEKFLQDYKGVLNKELTDKEKLCNIYNLNDDRIIYEMIDLNCYLFSNINDFKEFKIKASELSKNSNKSKFEIKDENFISKRDLYINLFCQNLDLNINFKNIDDLKKIDSLFRKNDVNDIIPKYNYSLIAIVGEFLKNNIENSEWKRLQINENSFAKYILYWGNDIQVPSDVLEEIVYNKSNLKRNTTFYKTIKGIVDYYKR